MLLCYTNQATNLGIKFSKTFSVIISVDMFIILAVGNEEQPNVLPYGCTNGWVDG